MIHDTISSLSRLRIRPACQPLTPSTSMAKSRTQGVKYEKLEYTWSAKADLILSAARVDRNLRILRSRNLTPEDHAFTLPF